MCAILKADPASVAAVGGLLGDGPAGGIGDHRPARGVGLLLLFPGVDAGERRVVLAAVRDRRADGHGLVDANIKFYSTKHHSTSKYR